MTRLWIFRYDGRIYMDETIVEKKRVLVFGYFINPKYNFTENMVKWHESVK